MFENLAPVRTSAWMSFVLQSQSSTMKPSSAIRRTRSSNGSVRNTISAHTASANIRRPRATRLLAGLSQRPSWAGGPDAVKPGAPTARARLEPRPPRLEAPLPGPARAHDFEVDFEVAV